MRILVTGGAGFIGSHVVEAFLAEGHEVAVIDNLSTGRRAHVPPAAKLHEVDIHAAELEGVFAAFRPEVVNHHAAQASVKLSTIDPVHDLEVNVGGTARVAALCVKHGVRKLIYASSGGTIYGEPGELPVAESHPIAPMSPYGASKFGGEMYVEVAGRSSALDYTILRYGNAFGPRQDPDGEAGVCAIFTKLMLAHEPCTIDGDGEQRKDYLYVGDIARANVLALDRGSRQAINIGTGRGTSVNEIHASLQRAAIDKTAPRFGPPRPGDVRNFWLTTARAREALGWDAQVSLDDGLALTVAALREEH
ncbi:MAG: NAD-dependent epimerase/dehydratase family protein [Tepidiformaceae bacterium]